MSVPHEPLSAGLSDVGTCLHYSGRCVVDLINSVHDKGLKSSLFVGDVLKDRHGICDHIETTTQTRLVSNTEQTAVVLLANKYG